MEDTLARRPRSTRWPRALLAAALVALAQPSCDSPACVFSGSCFGNGTNGTLGAHPAVVPPDGAWLLPVAPSVDEVFPSGSGASSTTAIAVLFSESIQASSAATAFQLQQVNPNFGGTGITVPLLPPALLAGGRLMVLLPATALPAGQNFELVLRDGAEVADLTGTPLNVPSDRVFGSFTTAETDPDAPRVVATWPMAGSTGLSPTGEIAVVFDRKVDADSVDSDSFEVTVDGSPPPFDPDPQQGDFSGGSGLPVLDTRAWSWRSVDAAGTPVPLGLGVKVLLTLSPADHQIVTGDGTELPETKTEFELAGFTAPLSAQVVSLPQEAIGLANLDGTMPLEVALEIDAGLASDRLGIYLFGTTLGTSPQLGALYREVTLGDIGYDVGTGIATLGEEQLKLTTSTDPVKARFADGDLSFAFTLKRSGTTSTVRMLDSDPDEVGIQSPLLDTTRPVLQELGVAPGGGLGLLRSDLRGLVVVGRANEPIRAAEVVTALGDNGALAPVSAYQTADDTLEQGFFVAAPVELGLIAPQDLPLAFDLRVYDRALNAAAAPTSSSFRQLGAVGPGTALPGSTTVTVEVFDAVDMAPVAGARVFTHELVGGVPVLVDSATSDADGRATLLASLAAETMVTVDATGFDLFTFSNAPNSRLGVPLLRQAAAPGSFQGLFSTGDPELSNLTKWAQDSRLLVAQAGRIPIENCSFNPLTFTYDCLFGPAPIVAGPAGVSAVVAVNPPPNEAVYTAQGFLQAWAARLPGLPVSAGTPTTLGFSVDGPLDAPEVPEESRALDGPAVDLDGSGLVRLDLSQLASAPIATVEARLRSLGGALLAGYGVSFPLAGSPTDTWRERCAFPGAVDFTDDKYPEDQLGPLVADGVIDPDLFLRLDVADTAGRASVRRPRFSALSGGGPVVLVSRPGPRRPSPRAGNRTVTTPASCART